LPGAVWFAGCSPACYVVAYIYLDSRFRCGHLVWPMGVAATTRSEVPHCNFDSPNTSTSASSSSLHLPRLLARRTLSILTLKWYSLVDGNCDMTVSSSRKVLDLLVY
jgi:hypothetical protein